MVIKSLYAIISNKEAFAATKLIHENYIHKNLPNKITTTF